MVPLREVRTAALIQFRCDQTEKEGLRKKAGQEGRRMATQARIYVCEGLVRDGFLTAPQAAGILNNEGPWASPDDTED